MSDTKSLLMEGVSDAAGFVGGSLLGYGLGQMMGLDLMAPGYGNGTLVAIALVAIGGGLGLQGARRWRASRIEKEKE
jgi:hypothetical protein